MSTNKQPHWSTWSDAATRQEMMDEFYSNPLNKVIGKVGDTYDRYLEDPLRKLPRLGQIGGFAALNAGATWLGNQLPWVSEENQSNPLLAAAIATPMEILEFDYINKMKDKYGTASTVEAKLMPMHDAALNMANKMEGSDGSFDTFKGAAKSGVKEFFAPYQDIYRKSNPFAKAAIMGSIVGGTAQLPISAYNSVMSLTGNKQLEINNDIGSAAAFGLGAIAPLTMSLVNKARGKV